MNRIRLKKCRVRRRSMYRVDCRDGQGKGARFFFARTEEGKKAAEQKIEDLIRANLLAEDQPILNPLVDREATLKSYGEKWLQQRGGRPRTKRSRADLFAQHVVPFDLGGGKTFGNLKVREITRGHVRLFVVEKRKDGYAPDSVRLMFRLLDPMLATAVADGVLLRHPIDRDLKHELRPYFKRDPRDEEVKPFTEKHARKFLLTAEQHSKLYPLYVTGFLEGLRLGELCGLQLDDDRVGVREGKRVRLLHIERQLGQECSVLDPKPGPPKNGVRDIDMAKQLCELFDCLKAERKRRALACGWRPIPPWAFITSNGTPYSQRNVLRDWNRVMKLAGLTESSYTPHSMRHTFATMHIMSKGAACAKWLQQQMGHSSISVTFDVYGDWFKLSDQRAATELGEALLGNGRSGNRSGNKR